MSTHNEIVPPASAPGGLSYIEQVTAIPCLRPRRPWVVGYSQERKAALIFQPRCRSWSCPACAEINRALWTFRIHYAAEVVINRGDTLTFVTITSHRRLSASGSLRVFKDAWPKLRKRYRRECPGAHYCLIPERHLSGTVHAHLLASASVGSRFWKDASAACGLGYIAQEEPCTEPARAAWYVSKYLAKQLAGYRWPPGFRRVRCSRGFPRPPDPPVPGDWRFQFVGKAQEVSKVEQTFKSRGYVVLTPNHAEAWSIITLLETVYADQTT